MASAIALPEFVFCALPFFGPTFPVKTGRCYLWMYFSVKHPLAWVLQILQGGVGRASPEHEQNEILEKTCDRGLEKTLRKSRSAAATNRPKVHARFS